jgi:16S rRNA (cytosine967-C5)-methyltransferase
MKKQLPAFYKELLQHIASTLDNIFIVGKPADKAIEQTMRLNKNWLGEKRNFFANAIYDCVRYRRLLEETAANYFTGSENSYQELIIVWFIYAGYELPDAGIYKTIDVPAVEKIISKISAIRKIRESIPDWLDEVGEKEVGSEWDALISALNKKPPITLRTNLLKTTPGELQQELKNERVNTELLDWCKGALEVTRFANLFRTNTFTKGFFEVQDAASQMVVNSMDIKPGMRVIDACAGTGGKTMHLASLMQNKGKIIALDTKDWRLEELKKRARRGGAHIIETKVLDSTKTVKRLAGSADRLLLDVPCSGFGVLKRNPDTKWKMTPEKLEDIKKEQRHILFSYSQMLKPNGRMVYATCSFLPSEGEEQVKWFLEEKKNEWELVSETRISPAKNNCDGFYIAVLQRSTKK